MSVPKKLKILSIGNSFSMDTMTHCAQIALALGVEEVKMGNLYIGGCPIEKHYANFTEDLADYNYYVNQGGEWSRTEGVSIRQAVTEEPWDWINIQHGSSGGHRYTRPECYSKLVPLIEGVRGLAWAGVKIAFNMTWVGEPDCGKGGMGDFGGDALGLYNAITALTREMLLPLPQLQCVSPTGTAIQNARTAAAEPLTRDGYHLSLSLGRYIAGLTFLKALTGMDISGIQWAPEGVTGAQRKLAVAAANSAVACPFSVTQMK